MTNLFENFTDEQLEIIDDMADEWADRDRHGLLASEHSYDTDQIATFGAMYEALSAETRKRGLRY